LLKRGSSGQDILQLQQILIAAGFLKIDAPTMYFGAQTEAALKAYQTAHGLDAVGYTGPKTRVLLNQGTVPTASETASSTAMTDAQKQTLIATLEAQLQTLLAEITALGATTTQTQ
jgi:peptidoglycan hydrolase-like protein with peptidoglycan-binding domain